MVDNAHIGDRFKSADGHARRVRFRKSMKALQVTMACTLLGFGLVWLLMAGWLSRFDDDARTAYFKAGCGVLGLYFFLLVVSAWFYVEKLLRLLCRAIEAKKKRDESKVKSSDGKPPLSPQQTFLRLSMTDV